MNSGDPRGIKDRTFPSSSEIHPSFEDTFPSRDASIPTQPSSREAHGEPLQNSNRYDTQSVNRVMRALSALMLHRNDRGAEIGFLQRRHEGRQASDPASRSPSGRPGTMVMREGRMVALPEKSENAGHSQAQTSSSPSVRPQARLSPSAAGNQDLSSFEKSFLAHFEGGALLGEKLPPGLQRFLKKAIQEWKALFAHLAPFETKKSAKASDLQAVIFRGLVEAEGGQGAPLLIADLKLPAAPGRLQPTWEKLVRLALSSTGGSIEAQNSLFTAFTGMNPGEALPEALVRELIAFLGSEISYTALSHRVTDPQAVNDQNRAIVESYQSPEQVLENALREGSRRATPGIALDARTERLMAETLDFPRFSESRIEGGAEDKGIVSERPDASVPTDPRSPESTRTAKGSSSKRKNLWGKFPNQESGDPSFPLLLPWLQKSNPQSFRGRPRWYIAFSYGIIGLAAVIGFYYLARHFL